MLVVQVSYLLHCTGISTYSVQGVSTCSTLVRTYCTGVTLVVMYVSVLAVYRYQCLLYRCKYFMQCIGVSTCCTGVGGQIDFLRGAAFGYDGLGKPIIAMASVAENGESKIVPYLKEGTYICYETLLVQVLFLHTF